MDKDRIECETLISAPVERVWALVSIPGIWVDYKATGPGAKEGEAVVANHEDYGDFPIRVEKVEPPTYLAYRWASAFPGEEPRAGNSTLIEFTLSEEGEQTRLRVVESGFAAIAASGEFRDEALQGNIKGWQAFFGLLKKRTEELPV